ncbi:ABC transporter permease [Gorillibacterium sp. sgz5001074]|uniref:ABC transporter permease n=1 Tax=Gorillibacterium sp. sgz5001074 TaxID=3446695 RepID=UPI003F66329D
MSVVRLYLQGMKTSIAGRMTDRADYLISMAIMLFFDMIMPLVTVIIYSTGASFPGWGLYEALLIQAIFLLAKGISYPFFFGLVWNTIGRVRDGTLDLLLIKPRSPLVMLIVTAFDAEDLGKLIGGVSLFAVALAHLPAMAWADWGAFWLLFGSAVLMFFAFALFMSGITIVWVGTYRVYEIFDSVTMFSLYPSSIFSKSFRNVITMLIPVAAMGSLPASVLLGRPAEGAVAAVPVVLLFTAASYGFWVRMMKRYKSAGG